MQVQVVPELLHFEFHKLCPHQQVAIETLTGMAEAGTELQLGGTAAAVVLLTVHTHMLTCERETSLFTYFPRNFDGFLRLTATIDVKLYFLNNCKKTKQKTPKMKSSLIYTENNSDLQ